MTTAKSCTTSVADLATDAVKTLQLYNRYLGLLGPTEDEVQRKFSKDFVNIGREATEISSRAAVEIQGKLEGMNEVAGKMLGGFELDEEALRNGRYNCGYLRLKYR